MFPLESRYSIITGPEFSNISEEQQQQKRPQHQLIEFFKEEMNKSIKEVRENTNKYLKEMKKNLYES